MISSFTDLEIDQRSSSDVVEAWKEHQITLRCVVNVADGVTPTFQWRRDSDNSTVTDRAKHSDTALSSTLKLYLGFPNEISNYTCIARTSTATAKHTVVVKKLCKFSNKCLW